MGERTTRSPFLTSWLRRLGRGLAALVDWKQMYDELLEKNNDNVRIANEIIAGKDAEIAGSPVAQAPRSKALGHQREGLPPQVGDCDGGCWLWLRPQGKAFANPAADSR